jgi:1-acyl-sn-glycerol-3-phosphate acyltransferase
VRRLFARLALYAFHLGFVRPLLRWVVGVRFRRRNLVPKGPCVVVSNHNSHLDAGVLMSLFPLRRLPHVHPVAAADYFGKHWFKRTMAMLLMNGIPIQRRATPGVDPLAPMIEALEAGESLIFFPEGSRGEAGVVTRFRPGVGKLARQIPGLLVVPVFLAGPERIWPRGEVVPVPLSMDAIVGKPRSYDPDEDPRAIAEQVQHDVLALAPPPPPEPAPRPAPPIRVGICGIDRTMRELVFLRVTERLGRVDRTMGIGETVYKAEGEGLEEITGPIPEARGRAWFNLLARVFRTSGWYIGEKFSQMVEQAQISEALGLRPATRFAVTEGNALVDLMAWSEADFYRGVFDESGMNHMMQYLSGQKRIPLSHWWKFIFNATEVWLVNVFNLARPPVPDVLVHLSVPVPRLMARLRSRGEKLQPHENEAFLTRLDDAYRQVGDVLRRRRKVEFFEFDPDRTELDAVVDEVEAVCRRLAESSLPAGEAVEKER